VRRRGRFSQIKAVIECAANGEVTQNELRKLGWSHFHIWVRYDKKVIDQSKAQRFGWYTTDWSRPMMLDTFIKAVKDGWVDINSPFLIDEMATLESSGPRGKLEAHLGDYDDRVMSFGIGFFSSVVLEQRGARQDMNQMRIRAREDARRAPVWTPGWQGSDIRPGAFMGEGEQAWGTFGAEGPEQETRRGGRTSYYPEVGWR
jgi:hypothetical protein